MAIVHRINCRRKIKRKCAHFDVITITCMSGQATGNPMTDWGMRERKTGLCSSGHNVLK
jgi:hypothetical protein